jgi:Coenzyme PQQ synthesis protein D (PqqD)
VEALMQGPGVLAQPDIRLYGDKELTDAIRDADDITPDESVLMLSFDHDLYELNSAGAMLWDALKSPRSIPELEELLSAFFGIPPEQAASDVEAFVTELRAVGLIRTASS